MALVDYGSGSDMSDEEMDTETTVTNVIVHPKKPFESQSTSSFNSNVNTSSFLKFDILPEPQEDNDSFPQEEGPIPPKKIYDSEEIEKPPDNTLRTLSSSSFATLRAQKIGGVMKISIPSLKDFANDEEESTGKKSRILQPSTKGSGLFAILPEPKHANSIQLGKVEVATTSTIQEKSEPSTSSSASIKSRNSSTPKSFIPAQALLGKRPPLSKLEEIRAKYMKQEANVRIVSRGGGEKKTKKNDSDESDDDTEDFFSFASANEEIPDDPSLRLPDYVPPQPVATVASVEPQVEESYEMREEISDADVMKFIQKGRKSKTEPINFIDVSADDLRPEQSTEWLKAVTAEPAVTSRKKDAPGGILKRKHQITYLAYEAKEREQALKNQWAQNAHNKRMTQSKYGF